MKRKPDFTNCNLIGVPVSRALEITKAISGKSYEQLAGEMNLGTETIHRYFTDPEYDPPFKRIPKLTKKLGNDVLLDWVCLNSGGYFVRINTGDVRSLNLDIQIANLTKEFSDVLSTDAEAKLSGRSMDKLRTLGKEVSEMLVKGQQVLGLIQSQIEAAK